MIEIEISKTINFNRIGNYKLFSNELNIGSNISNYIYIPEDNFPQELFKLSINENKLFINPVQNELQYHLNGKIFKITKELKNNDVIKFNQTEFKILNFIEEKIITRKEFLNNRVKEIGESNHQLLNLVQELSK